MFNSPSIYKLLLLPFLCFITTTKAQYFTSKPYPQGYFRNPLNIPILLSGNFGQLRPGHFHMGLDIRTNQSENLPVVAAADGYISRIKIEKLGYGRAIYITHPNGYTTVYAHLNNFYDTLNKFLIEKQYAEQKWEQDFELNPNQFKVSKGQFIAFSGNSGASRGAHLHFEIRDSTGNVQNPLLFGFNIADNVLPVIHKLFLYNREVSTFETRPLEVKIKGSKGVYTLADSMLLVDDSKISFAIAGEDYIGSSTFKMGYYQTEVWLDSCAIYASRINDFSYPNSRYINAYIDYKEKFNGNGTIQHLSKLPGNRHSVFSTTLGNGVIELKDTATHFAEIIVKDAAGNFSTLSFFYKKKDSIVSTTKSTLEEIKIQPDSSFNFEKDGIKLSFKKTAFYDTLSFKCEEIKPVNSNEISSTYKIASAEIPVHNYYSISIKPSANIIDSLKSKVLLYLKNKEIVETSSTIIKSDYYEGSFEKLGSISLVIDTLAPIIQILPPNKNFDYSNSKTLSLKITDNFTNIKNFYAELDGKWLMFSKKDDYFTYQFDEHCSIGKHELTITAEDEVGNTATRHFSFVRELSKPNKMKKKVLNKGKKKKQSSAKKKKKK